MGQNLPMIFQTQLSVARKQMPLFDQGKLWSLWDEQTTDYTPPGEDWKRTHDQAIVLGEITSWGLQSSLKHPVRRKSIFQEEASKHMYYIRRSVRPQEKCINQKTVSLYKRVWGLNSPYILICIYLLHRESGDSLPGNLQGPTPELPSGRLEWHPPRCSVQNSQHDSDGKARRSPHIQDLYQVQL